MRSVDVTPVFDAQHDYRAGVLVYSVEHTVGATANGPDSGQFVPKRFADSPWLRYQRGR